MKFRAPTDEPLHIGLTSGHTAVVTPEGNELEQMFHREAIARGAIPGSVTDTVAQEQSGFNRKEVVTNAVNEMLDGGDEGDFTSDGKPNLRKLTAKVGFTVAREEADAIWAEITAAKT